MIITTVIMGKINTCLITSKCCGKKKMPAVLCFDDDVCLREINSHRSKSLTMNDYPMHFHRQRSIRTFTRTCTHTWLSELSSSIPPSPQRTENEINLNAPLPPTSKRKRKRKKMIRRQEPSRQACPG